MPEASAGTVRVDIIANASDLETQIKKAKSLVSSMGPDFEKSFSQMSAAQKRATTDALKFEQRIGMSTDAVKLLNLAARGAAPEALEKLRQSLLSAGQAAQTSASKFNKYGLTAGQEAMALRGVPAQITDILTSLQGGQRPLTVLLQQGGQLKDMFGGVAPAARALGGAVLGMINPFTVAAAAVGALAYGYIEGAKEDEEFRKSLVLTNGAIGVSVEGLQLLAGSIAKVTGSHAEAAQVLNLFARDAKVSTSDLRDFAQVAIQWSEASGQSVEDVVKNFTDLANDPLKGIEKLNESMHFLTAATDEQVRSLQESGRQTDAATLAQRTYADVLKERTPQMVKNLGLIESAWKEIKKVGSEAVDTLLNIGRAQSSFQKLADEQAKLKVMEGMVTPFGGPSKAAIANQKAVIANLQEQIRWQSNADTQQAASERDRAAALKLSQERASYLKGGRTKEQQRNDDIQAESLKWKDLSAGLESGSAMYEKLYAAHQERLTQINKKYEDKPKAAQQSAADRMLDTLRQQQAEMQAQLGSSEKMTSAQQALVKFNQQIADLKGKSILTADQKSLLANQDAIRAQLQKNVELSKELQTKQEMAKLDQRAAQIQQQIASSNQNRAQQYQDQLGAVGLGQQEQERVRSQEDIRREYQRYQDRLTKGLSEGALSSPEFAAKSAQIDAQMQAALKDQQNYYAQLDALNADWRNGFSSAIDDYSDKVKNVAAATKSAFTDAFQGMEDALTTFVTTGKLSFTDLANSIVKDMVRIAVQQSITGPLAGALGNAIGNSALFNNGVSGLATASAIQKAGGDGIGSLIASNGWAAGGYTGPGGRFQPAGIVHRGEGVLNRDEIRAIGGEAGFNALRRSIRGPGHALGGMGGNPMASTQQPLRQQLPQIVFNIMTPDAESFRRSQGQLARQAMSAMQRATVRA